MGSYTARQKLYKVAPDEIVDPETNLNFNLRKLDDSVKHLVGWGPTDTDYIGGSENVANGRKFLKRQSNSTWICWDGVATQDNVAYTNGWTPVSASEYTNGWNNMPGQGRVMHCVDPDGSVTLRGSARLNSYDPITAKTAYNVITLPAAARPSTVRYFNTAGGPADGTSYSTFRISIATSGIIEIVRYGGTQSQLLDRYVSFDGVTYPKVS